MSDRRPAICCTLTLLLTVVAMIVLSVYVNHGLVQQRLDIAAGRGNQTNCTVISTEITGVTSLTLQGTWYWAVYSISVDITTSASDHNSVISQGQDIYYNPSTNEGVNQAGDTIKCYCNGSRCVLWLISRETPRLQGLVLGLIATVVITVVLALLTYLACKNLSVFDIDSIWVDGYWRVSGKKVWNEAEAEKELMEEV